MTGEGQRDIGQDVSEVSSGGVTEAALLDRRCAGGVDSKERDLARLSRSDVARENDGSPPRTNAQRR
jgi:hypothetical protein